jgi:hypothetical protein
MRRSDAGVFKLGVVLLTAPVCGCSLLGGVGRPQAAGGVSLTPPPYYTSYYSTPKARALGEQYSRNLDRLLEQVVQSPVGRLQFANAIVSLGMGLFTHSASQPPDERYLGVLIGMPDILEGHRDFAAKVEQLFTQYGWDLLSILSSDVELGSDPKIAGYGLSFSWRNLTRTPSGPRLTVEEVVIYLPKASTDRFVKGLIDQEELLRSAVWFARQGEQPARLVRPASLAPQPAGQSPTH